MYFDVMITCLVGWCLLTYFFSVKRKEVESSRTFLHDFFFHSLLNTERPFLESFCCFFCFCAIGKSEANRYYNCIIMFHLYSTTWGNPKFCAFLQYLVKNQILQNKIPLTNFVDEKYCVFVGFFHQNSLTFLSQWLLLRSNTESNAAAPWWIM